MTVQLVGMVLPQMYLERFSVVKPLNNQQFSAGVQKYLIIFVPDYPYITYIFLYLKVNHVIVYMYISKTAMMFTEELCTMIQKAIVQIIQTYNRFFL